MSGKVLTVYFSMKGETLEGRDIVLREKGHAQLAAAFLESMDWSGKTIIPVNTSNSSGTGYSVRDIRMLSQSAEVKTGLELRGQDVRSMKDRI